MKKTIAVSAAILTFLVSAAALARPGGMGHWMTPDLRVERMTGNLDLTAEQPFDLLFVDCDCIFKGEVAKGLHKAPCGRQVTKDQSAFSRSFKATTGLTPAQYRSAAENA